MFKCLSVYLWSRYITIRVGFFSSWYMYWWDLGKRKVPLSFCIRGLSKKLYLYILYIDRPFKKGHGCCFYIMKKNLFFLLFSLLALYSPASPDRLKYLISKFPEGVKNIRLTKSMIILFQTKLEVCRKSEKINNIDKFSCYYYASYST